jgi:polyisoprenoid-binding protein YceI
MLKPLLLSLSLLSTQAFAAWQLDNDASQLSFTSIKKNSIAENHHFEQLSAQIDNNQLSMVIELASIESLIPIRNERMQKMLFNVAQFPKAVIEADLAPYLGSLKLGHQVLKSVPVTLNLHGQKQQLMLDLAVVQTARQLIVSPTKAVLVNAADYKLELGIEALRKIAGLDSIAQSVPVTFNLVFNQQDF